MTREWDAASYHRLSDPQYGWGQRVLQRVSARGDETIIDAGCGTARLTVELAAHIPRGRVLAVDQSENMLRQARAYINAARSKSNDAPIHLICASAATLPFIEVADGIFSTAVFHWIADHDALFKSLFAALKPGGWLVAQCGGGDNLLRLRQRTDIAMRSAEFAEYFQGWNPPQFYAGERDTAERLRRAGFTNVAVWLHREDVAFADAQTYRDFLATVTCHTHIARIPDPALRARFIDLLVEQSIADPTLLLDYWRLNISARKSHSSF